VQQQYIMKKTTLLLGGLALGAALALTPSAVKASILGSSHDFSSETGSGSDSTKGIATFNWYGISTTVTNGGVVSANPLATYQNPCQVCHIPHLAAPMGAVNAPLWNHAIAANPASQYVTYNQGTSATFNQLGLSVTLGSSLACLSCHDGSIAVNQSYGSSSINANTTAAVYAPVITTVSSTGAAPPRNSGTLGNSLEQMHPVGVSYSAAEAVDPDLNKAPAYSAVGVPSTLLARMLKGPNQTVECASCHDIHRTFGWTVSGAGNDDLIVNLDQAQLCLTCHNK